jgi:hypothetical protein
LGEAVKEERFLAYFEIFKNHDPEAVLTAINQAGIACKFFPKPAELIELMTGGKGGGQDPTVAWQQVLDALAMVGGYSNAKFGDGAIAAAIDGLGGWVWLSQQTYEDISTQRIQARFEALYREAVRQGRHHQPGEVVGSCATSNAALGFAARGFEVPERTVPARSAEEIMADSAERGKLQPKVAEKESLRPEHKAALTLLAAKKSL